MKASSHSCFSSWRRRPLTRQGDRLSPAPEGSGIEAGGGSAARDREQLAAATRTVRPALRGPVAPALIRAGSSPNRSWSAPGAVRGSRKSVRRRQPAPGKRRPSKVKSEPGPESWLYDAERPCRRRHWLRRDKACSRWLSGNWRPRPWRCVARDQAREEVPGSVTPEPPALCRHEIEGPAPRSRRHKGGKRRPVTPPKIHPWAVSVGAREGGDEAPSRPVAATRQNRLHRSCIAGVARRAAVGHRAVGPSFGSPARCRPADAGKQERSRSGWRVCRHRARLSATGSPTA